MQKPGPKPFDTLVAPHLQTLFRMAYRLVRHVPDAQDLVQDTCLAACRNLQEIAAADSPLRWLLRVQHNRFIDLHRRSGRAPIASAEETGDAAALVDTLPDPEQLMQQFQDEQLLERAFLQLDGMQRTLLSLRAEGYDLPEIETITGVERGVLSARLHRARLRLAQLIAGMDHESRITHRIGSRS